MVEIGKCYYFVAHAYYHYIAEVTEIIGVRRVATRNTIQLHSCPRGWSEFLRNGCQTDTNYSVIGEIAEVSFIIAIPWKHDVPTEPRVLP